MIKKTHNNYLILSFFILLSTIFLSIGYASINSITGYVYGEANVLSGTGLFITNVELSNSNGATGRVDNYYNTIMNSDIILSTTDPNSYITYKVTIYNKTNDKYTYIGTNYDTEFYNNQHIDFFVDKEPYDIENSSINPGETMDLYITYKYEENVNLSQVNHDLLAVLDFKFYVLRSDFNVIESCTKKVGNKYVEYEGCTLNTWTNGDVTLTVEKNEDNTEEYISYSFDNGITWQSSPIKTFTYDQTVKVKTKNTDGIESAPIEIEIDHIDKDDPVIKNINSKDLKVVLDEDNPVSTLVDNYVTDEPLVSSNLYRSSGIDKTEVYFTSTNTRINNTNTIDNVGFYCVTLVVTDNAGNITTLNTDLLVRWPTGGKYIVRWTEINGSGLMGEGLATDSTKDGLYKDDINTGLNNSLPYSSKYFYAGDVVENYLTFANTSFRVLNIAVNDDIKLIGPLSSKTIDWGSRKIYESDFYANWVNWWNEKSLYNPSDSNRIVYTDEQWAHVANATYYAGRFNRTDSQTLAQHIELERTSGRELGGNNSPSFNGYSAIPNVSDYLKSSNRQDIVYNIRTSQTNQSVFGANTYLSQSEEQWTMNSKRATSTDNDFWVLLGGNEIVSRTQYYNEKYRPVIYITSSSILSGSGTTSDPFIVQEDYSWFDNNYLVCNNN